MKLNNFGLIKSRISNYILPTVKTNDKIWDKIHLVVFVGLLLRIFLAFKSEQIYYADELFQYLEQAHRLVFGYGYIPWEYRFGLRSWFLPFLISPFLFFTKVTGLGKPEFYVPLVKTFFCLLSVSSIYFSYFIGRRLVNENAGRLAALVFMFWYELLYFAHRPLTEIISSYFLLGAIYFLISNKSKPIAFGIFSAFTIILRIHFSICIAFLVLISLMILKKKQLLKAAIGFFTIIIFSGMLDLFTWGKPFISFYNLFYYNIIKDVSSNFGVMPWYYFFENLYITSGIFIFFAIFFCFIFLKSNLIILINIALILIPHSLIAHKEYRFIIASIPLILIIYAIICENLSQLLIFKSQKITIKIIFISILLAISIFGIFSKLPGQKKIYFTKNLLAKDRTIMLMQILNKEKKISNIYINFNGLYLCNGGFYYLHRDCEIIHPRISKKGIPENPHSLEFAQTYSHLVSYHDKDKLAYFNMIWESKNRDLINQNGKLFKKKLKLFRNKNPHQKFKKLKINSQNVKVSIDNSYKPKVKSRF